MSHVIGSDITIVHQETVTHSAELLITRYIFIRGDGKRYYADVKFTPEIMADPLFDQPAYVRQVCANEGKPVTRRAKSA